MIAQSAVICEVCHKDCDVYMVHDALWLSVADPETSLCIPCFETKLGRRLVRADFADVLINRWSSVLPGVLQDRYNPTRLELAQAAWELLALRAKLQP